MIPQRKVTVNEVTALTRKISPLMLVESATRNGPSNRLEFLDNS